MQRPGFFKRLTLNMLLIALIWSPFVVFQDETGVERAALQAGNALSNSNAYAAWFGYCLLVLWLWSLKPGTPVKQNFLRSLAGVALVLALRTVSRGFIISVGAALLTSLRKIKLTRTIALSLVYGVILVVLVTTVPAIREIWQSYNVRFAEQTARINVLNLGIQAIAAQPIIGYGVSSLRRILPITPHNELILLWITSGIVPAILYIAFVIYTLRLAIRYERKEQFINPLPLIVFTVIEIAATNIVLPRLWAVSAVCYVFAIGDWLQAEQKTELSVEPAEDDAQSARLRYKRQNRSLRRKTEGKALLTK